MIEPTDDMDRAYMQARDAYWKAIDSDTGVGGLTVAGHERLARRQALAAVFALIERDYRVETKRCQRIDCDHKYCGGRS